MPRYRYRALHSEKGVIRGTAMAHSQDALARTLQGQGLELLETKAAASFALTLPRLSNAPKLSAFCRQMQDLIASGLPFDEALSLLIGLQPEGDFKDSLSSVHNAFLNGASPSQAFAAQPSFSDPLFCAGLRAGESSGDLGEAFGRLAEEAQTREQLRANLKKALRYPAFLFAVAGFVFWFMTGFVVPEIVSFLDSLGGTLPTSTKILIVMARHASAFGLYGGLALLSVFCFFFFGARSSASLRLKRDRLLLRLPFVGSILRRAAYDRFFRALGTLLRSGASLPDALLLATTLLGNTHLRDQATAAHAALITGSSLSGALQDFATPFAYAILRVGENAGRLDRSLGDIVRTNATELDETIESGVKSLEPVLTLFIGGLLGWIVLAVLGPVYAQLGLLGRA